MRKLCLVLLVCVACGTKKPPAQPSPPPPSSEDQGKKPDEPKPAPGPTTVPRTGDPCDGGQKPH